MLLRRENAYPDVWERKTFKGPLDIRAPEDRLVVDPAHSDGHTITSPAINSALINFDEAMKSGMQDAVKRAARDVVDATSAYFRMSGVPTFAHDPVPPQLLHSVLPLDHLDSGEHTTQAIGHFLDAFDHSVRPALREQVKRHVEQDGAGSDRSATVPLVADSEGDGRERDRTSTQGERGTVLQPLLSADANRDAGSLGGDEESARRERALGILRDAITTLNTRANTEVRRANANGAEFQTIPFARGEINTDGNPSDGEGGPDLFQKVGLVSSVGRLGRWLLKTRGRKALVGAGLSAAAEWAAARGKEDKDQPGVLDYLLAITSGAISGGMDLKRGKAELDAALAIGTTILGDIASNRGVSMPRALGAALVAFVVSKLGSRSELAGVGAQGASKIGRKFGEKVLKEMLKSVFGVELELTDKELAEMWKSFDENWGRQWNEFLYTDDRDPFN